MVSPLYWWRFCTSVLSFSSFYFIYRYFCAVSFELVWQLKCIHPPLQRPVEVIAMFNDTKCRPAPCNWVTVFIAWAGSSTDIGMCLPHAYIIHVYGNRSTSQGIKLQNHLLKDCSYSMWCPIGKIYPITYKAAPLDMSNIPMCCLGNGIYRICSKQWIGIFTWIGVLNSAFSFVLQSYSETSIVLLCTLQFVRVTLCFHHPGLWALWGL